MSHTSITGEGAANGTENEMLIALEKVLRDNKGAVERDVDRLGEFEGVVLWIREFDKNLEPDAWFGPIDTDIRGHGCAPKLYLLEGQAGVVLTEEMLVR